ncbi:hypothetical protein OG563_17840 [Nocardia vinacea]|uniref:Cation transporter n=1 Tax=Nocardia vinacea TaxID=96468 RepID=A0ABZ1Z7E5_9NOCA|nr:hypothetical protein [Nocardia vinacea]
MRLADRSAIESSPDADLLVGLLANLLLGWSWADPIAALVIAAIAIKEGVSAWHGDTCCPSTEKF